MIYNKSNFDINAFHNATIIKKEFKSPGLDRKWHLYDAMEECRISGHVLEFGVYVGKTIKHIAYQFPNQTIWGFDSFEGLPEKWIRSSNEDKAPSRDKGYFSLESLPEVDKNVKLVKGFFSESLPQWILENPGQVKFLHVDCDLYSSTKEILTMLNSQIVPGTVIVFDEMYPWRLYHMYDKWAECEYKALKEWLHEFDREFETLYRNRYQQCSIRITK